MARGDRRYLALMRIVRRGGTGPLVALVFALALTATLPIAASVVNAELVGSIPSAVRADDSSSIRQHLTLVLLLAVVVTVLRAVASAWSGYQQGRVARRVSAVAQQDLFEAVLAPVTVAHLEDHGTLDRIHRCQEFGGGRFSAAVGVTAGAGLLVSWITAALAAVVVASWSPLVALGLVGAHVGLNRWNNAVFQQLTHNQVEHTPDLRRADLLFHLSTGPLAAKEIRLFGLGQFLAARYHKAWWSATEPIWQARRGLAPRFIASAMVDGTSVAVAAAMAVRAAREGVLDLAALVLMLQNIVNVRGFSVLGVNGLLLSYSAERAAVLRDLRRELLPTASGGMVPASPLGAIRFEGVAFAYPGAERPVYEGLDLVIEPGTCLAIVGLNGVGKTTLVKLLTRLHDPTSGRVTVGGVDVRELDPGMWHTKVAAIFQDFTRFELSLADNVGFGSSSLASDPAALERALDRAGGADLIGELPNGWDTPLTPRVTGGADLSGGQWQRVALARALLALEGGAELLVLDEPAAALDVRSEAAMVQRLLAVRDGVTTIVISHRFSTVRYCDRIVVVEGGRVIEDGSHDDLVGARGRYAELFDLQARRFRDDVEPEREVAT